MRITSCGYVHAAATSFAADESAKYLFLDYPHVDEVVTGKVAKRSTMHQWLESTMENSKFEESLEFVE